MSIRVLLVDDTALFRRAIASLLAGEPDMEVVGEAGNGLEGVEKALELGPDVVLLDMDMPVMGGLVAARILRERLPEARLVMLTVSEDDDAFLEAIRLGVRGYLLKDLRPDELFDMIRSVMRDETPVAPALVTRLLTEFRELDRRPNPLAPTAGDEPLLSARELEIMRLVAQGLTNKEIGSRLSITEGTVKNHVHNSLAKLKMDNRIQAATYIVRQGWGGAG